MDAEFEEKEYEGPLNAQLLSGNINVWSPGQVFEKHIGVDAALEIRRHDFWGIFGVSTPLEGIVLAHYNFGYIWKKIRKRRALPTFKLNLFLQVKRPEGLKYRSSKLKSLGIKSPFWRFSIKIHQQKLLSKLKSKLDNRAFVVYGCSAFHTLKELYNHIKSKSIVENSTFVKVERLNNHSKWIYDKPGSVGIAMSEPEWVDGPDLFEEIKSTVANFDVENDNPENNLNILYNAIVETCEENRGGNLVAEEFEKRRLYINDLRISNPDKHYLSIVTFSQLTNCNWFVLG